MLLTDSNQIAIERKPNGFSSNEVDQSFIYKVSIQKIKYYGCPYQKISIKQRNPSKNEKGMSSPKL